MEQVSRFASLIVTVRRILYFKSYRTSKKSHSEHSINCPRVGHFEIVRYSSLKEIENYLEAMPVSPFHLLNGNVSPSSVISESCD